MPYRNPETQTPTHVVENQPPVEVNVDAAVLARAVKKLEGRLWMSSLSFLLF